MTRLPNPNHVVLVLILIVSQLVDCQPNRPPGGPGGGPRGPGGQGPRGPPGGHGPKGIGSQGPQGPQGPIGRGQQMSNGPGKNMPHNNNGPNQSQRQGPHQRGPNGPGPNGPAGMREGPFKQGGYGGPHGSGGPGRPGGRGPGGPNGPHGQAGQGMFPGSPGEMMLQEYEGGNSYSYDSLNPGDSEEIISAMAEEIKHAPAPMQAELRQDLPKMVHHVEDNLARDAGYRSYSAYIKTDNRNSYSSKSPSVVDNLIVILLSTMTLALL